MDSWAFRWYRWNALPYSRDVYTITGASARETSVSVTLIRAMKRRART